VVTSVKCQSCKRRKAVWRVGNDGFNAKRGAKVCDSWSCRAWGTGGYPVTLHPIEKRQVETP
jgi:hypothetical protein